MSGAFAAPSVMKIGISTYSLFQELKQGRMSVLDVIDWIADLGAQHVEIVPMGFDLSNNPQLIAQIVDKVQQRNIAISNYAIGANFAVGTDEDLSGEIERVKSQVDIAARLGVSQMRFDAGWLPPEKSSILDFETRLSGMAQAIKSVAAYAETQGVLVTVENHGFFVQQSDRVIRLISEVNHPNYRSTVDVGNFMCVDEDALVAVRKMLPYASMVHIKDFYRRDKNPGEGWFQTSGGYYLRGAMIGNGDLNIPPILREIQSAGYDGYVSVEFEGMENALDGTRISYENLKNLIQELMA